MNELVMPAAPTNVVIGVCGDQGAGKTIFLTCVFQSIWTVFPDDLILDFDRREIGNADRFADFERDLIESASVEGTQEDVTVPARIYVKPAMPLTGGVRPVLSVDIKDFAGGHFRHLANLKVLNQSRFADSAADKVLREVDDTLTRADAFVILIDSTKIDPLDETPKANPFTPSVNFMLSHCRESGVPVALLFSKSDQTRRRLTEDVFRSMPRVQAFTRQFTSDRREAAEGRRPFGLVQRIACYETVEGDLAPIRHTMDGSIWKPEPAEIVLELLRAAMPRIRKRIQDEIDAKRKKTLEVEFKAVKRRGGLRNAGIITLVALLLITGMSLLWQHIDSENQKLQLLRDMESRISAGNLASISSAQEAAAGPILAAYHADRGGASAAVKSAIRNVEAAFGDAGQILTDRPSLNPTYAAEVQRFIALAPLIDPENDSSWRRTVLPVLNARSAFLTDWLAANPQGDRTALLDDALRRLGTDEAFARVLSEARSREQRHAA